jgi:hypothetical protein
MARRYAWLRWSAGWSTCFFMAGCLFHSETQPERPFDPKAPPRTATTDLAEPPQMPADAVSEILSPYRPFALQPVARLASASDPPAPLCVVEGIKPLPLPESAEEPVCNLEKAPPPVKDSPLVSALRCALDKHPDEALALLEKYEKTDRKFLLALLRLTADVGELPSLTPEEVEQALEQLGALTEHLRRRAPLALGKVCFCRKIDNFGQYVALPPDYEFQAGLERRPGERVQVYAEVRNFASHPRNGVYETKLVSSLTIHKLELTKKKSQQKEAGKQPEDVLLNLGTYTDHSQTPRQDLFLNFQFHVPPRVPPGLYTLSVIVKDVTPGAPQQPSGERVARRLLELRVCRPGTCSLR